MTTTITAQQVQEHNSRGKGVWVIIHNKVYDVTEWLDDHPGGAKIILKYAGKDATEEFEPIHPPGTLEDNLPAEKCLGPLDMSSVKEIEKPKDSVAVVKKEAATPSSSGERTKEPINKPKSADAQGSLPPLDQVLSLHDFEGLAKRFMKEKGWAYYSSGSDDEVTMRENHMVFHRIWFRPRILRPVKDVDYSCSVLGIKSSMPIYITATALGKLGHPEGELNLTRAAGKHGVIQMIPTLASCSLDELLAAKLPEQNQWLQLYVNADRERTKAIIRKAEKGGVKALFITVDAPQLGRREKDMRQKFEDLGSEVQATGKDDVKKDEGAARAISSFIDPALEWKDLAWFKTVTKLPIILKGVQCYEDVLLAIEAGMQGVVLSNHGGRQLEFARSSIEVLVEVTTELRKRKMWPRPGFEILVDGGLRRASDALKAVALGASAVGVGRPFLYAMSTYGQEGVEKALQILKDEFEMNMRLIGAPKMSDLNPDYVDARSVFTHVSFPGESLFSQNYEALVGATPSARL